MHRLHILLKHNLWKTLPQYNISITGIETLHSVLQSTLEGQGSIILRLSEDLIEGRLQRVGVPHQGIEVRRHVEENVWAECG